MKPSWVRSHWWENDILFSLKGNSLSQESFTLSLALKVGNFWFQASSFLHLNKSRKEQPSLFLLSFVLHFIYLFVSLFCFVYFSTPSNFEVSLSQLKRKREREDEKMETKRERAKEKLTELLTFFSHFSFSFSLFTVLWHPRERAYPETEPQLNVFHWRVVYKWSEIRLS